MSITIKSGDSGNVARVNSQNRLLVEGKNLSFDLVAASSGRSYFISAPNVTLTSANASGLLYVMNTDVLPIVFSAFFFSVGISTGGAAGAVAQGVLLRNPSGGTLIDSGSPVTLTNRNYGVITPATATVLSGVEGSTVTGHTEHGRVFLSPGRTTVVQSEVVLPSNTSAALQIIPPAGNTSMVVNMAGIVNFMLEDEGAF